MFWYFRYFTAPPAPSSPESRDEHNNGGKGEKVIIANTACQLTSRKQLGDPRCSKHGTHESDVSGEVEGSITGETRYPSNVSGGGRVYS